MAILEPDTFLRPANAAVVLLDTAQTGILACGMMVLMISGMFDLSIGGILAFSGIMAGLAAKNLGLPPIVAFLVGCGWGMLLGCINGFLVTRFKINALIATLATLSIYRGGLQLVSGAGVTNIGNGFTVFGQTQILGIYSPFWFMAVIVAAVRLPGRPHALLPPGLLHRRQCPGGEALRHQRRPDGVQLLRRSWDCCRASRARCSPRA